MRLAPVRESRIPRIVDVIGWCRCPVRTLEASIGSPDSHRAFRGGSCSFASWSSSMYFTGGGGVMDVNRCIHPVVLQLGYLASSSVAFTLPAGSCRTDGSAVSPNPGFPNMLLSPRPFRVQVGSVTQEYYAHLLPCSTGINYAVKRRTQDHQPSPVATSHRHSIAVFRLDCTPCRDSIEEFEEKRLAKQPP
jgi:hypothetical protein